MADELESLIAQILAGADADDADGDAIYLTVALASAELHADPFGPSSPTAPNQVATFRALVEKYGKIWCFLTDVTKTQAYRDGIGAVRKQYRGIANDPHLQSQLSTAVAKLLPGGDLDSVGQAVFNNVHLSSRALGRAMPG